MLKLAEPAPERFAPAPPLASDAVVERADAVLIAGYGITENGTGSGRLRSVRTT